MEWHRREFTISTDTQRLDVDAIQAFLEDDSYWAKNRTPKQTGTAIEKWICFGHYHGERQIGFTRVVSDRATFAHVGDVYVIDEFRGQGLSKWLMETMLAHPELQGLRRWVLATRDAHRLYAQCGFTELVRPERWMELAAPSAY